MTPAAERVMTLVSGLPSGERERRSFMILQTFIDDSGSEPQAPYFVLGGFVAPTLSWLKFSDDWQAVLDQTPGLEYFKMTEAANLIGQFSRKKGWDETRRNARVMQFIYVIKKYAQLRVSVAVKHDDFKKHIKSLAVPTRILASDSPYFLLFTALIMNVTGLSSVFAATSKCQFIFDEQVGYDTEIMLQWPMFKHIATTGSRTNFAPFIEGPPLFMNENTFLPLQAADLYAWQIRNELVRSRQAGEQGRRIQDYPEHENA